MYYTTVQMFVYVLFPLRCVYFDCLDKMDEVSEVREAFICPGAKRSNYDKHPEPHAHPQQMKSKHISQAYVPAL